ncbi:TlyA family RNA methyltransferase [Exilibacterium tricleocarpae]|uniref:TlyA family RNA methyltransferase n=1 Tax=Exilibacterium tricleocarpae TaxID=2591008 RepID=A0A545TZN8_9GAMM|nr:TlyA family RNA methyltransferase [Exilibacterium tricleocarpae]TQV82679.1 TlyA family RNA methyltransferase [Exilibacterium tricleocarpae]
MTTEIRADVLLVTRGLAASRTQAQRLIGRQRVQFLAGGRWQSLAKPSLKLAADTQFTVAADAAERYVSRGGLKLAAALQRMDLAVTDAVALDVGQSTGGFTDCLLQAGAARVVGVDVGRGQLAPALRDHPQVVCLEGVNARQLPAAQLLGYTGGGGFDIAVMDIAFISQTLVLTGLAPLIGAGGHFVSLVKPQFEVGRAGVGKGGLVRDPALYKQVEAKIRRSVEACGLVIADYFDSPITGGDGNREFLLVARKPGR